MAAEKKGTTIVIKKIYVTTGGHGGSWKVALADFMTAMMAFFLVMWLLNQTEETKKAVSEYFSSPSIIEYNFQNYGATLSLEKLFLDLINEPLKAFQTFLEPADRTPNALDMGSQKVVAAYMADKLGDIAKNVSVGADGFEFDIMDYELFKKGSSTPQPDFIKQMNRFKALSQGLEDGIVRIESRLFYQSVEGSNSLLSQKVAAQRLEPLKNFIQSSFESTSNDLFVSYNVISKKDFIEGQDTRPPGMIRITVRQKPFKSDGKKPRKLDALFGESKVDMKAYEELVKRTSK